MATKKKTKKVKAVTVVEHSNIPVIREKDLGPEKSNKKYMIPQTWVSEKQVLHMVQKTPAKYVYKRPAKGGGEWDYVPGWYVTRILNYVFGWNWDFEIVREGREGDLVYVLGKLTVKGNKIGQQITKTQYGRAEIKMKKNTNIPLDYGNDLKAAATDSLKKCASMFGIAHDIYGKEEMKREANVDVKTDTTTPDVQMGAPSPKEYVKGPDGEDTLVCSNCGDPIHQAVYDFSKKIFKKPLCRECQNNTQGKK